MKKLTIIIGLVFLCTSCFVRKGYWVESKCRPKKVNFKLLKKTFNETDKLVFNKVYTLNGDKKQALGFYKDGRLILTFDYNKDIQNYDILSQDFIQNNDWNNARFIGCWRVENDKIEVEYFVCGNSGDYIRKQGKIKRDTIIFERDCGTSNPFITVKCPEKYVLSDMSFE